MTSEEVKIVNAILSTIINMQEDLTQPIYVIASFWCGRFNGIREFTQNGDNDYAEIEQLFQNNYAWKENSFGVTEQSYELIKIDLTKMLDCRGNGKDTKELKEYCTSAEDIKNSILSPDERKKIVEKHKDKKFTF